MDFWACKQAKEPLLDKCLCHFLWTINNIENGTFYGTFLKRTCFLTWLKENYTFESIILKQNSLGVIGIVQHENNN